MPQNILAKVQAGPYAKYIGLGFIPDWVKIWSGAAGTDYCYLEWNIGMMATTTIAGGIVMVDTTGDRVALARTAGIEIYRGGTVLSTSTTPRSSTAGVATANVYYGPDSDVDKRNNGSTSTISAWTLGSSANRTGNWDFVCDAIETADSHNPVGVGSMINIDGKETYITAITSNGEAANEVTLNEALASGPIYKLTGKYTHASQAAGTVTKAGIIINDVTYVNLTAADTMVIEAGTYR